MKSKLLKSVAAVLGFTSLFSFAACSGALDGGDAEVVVWEAPNTVKILRDIDYSGQYGYGEGAQLNFSLARNEYEGAQLILSKDSPLSSTYTVETADLSGPNGAKLTKDNFEIYHESYIEVTRATSTSAGFPLGFYPDALVPYDAAVDAGLNTWKDGTNQGIYIVVKTEQDTKAGLYTGSFTLNAGGETYDVPVSVEVWDFEVPEENHVRTAFHLFRDYLMNGELDTTEEMFEKYFDFLLDYRVSTETLPSFGTVEEYVECAKKYAADPRCSAYNLYMEGGSRMIEEIGRYGYALDVELFEEYMRALIENSTPQVNLIEKLYFYVPGLDEPHSGEPDRMPETKYANEQIIDKLIEIADSYTDEQLESYGLEREDIVKIENVVTAPYYSEMQGVRTFCPLISEFDTESDRAVYTEQAKQAYTGKNGELEGTNFGTTWWYIANIPYTPYPSYHMDAQLITARVIPWMQMNYGINGLLYWGSATYVEVTETPVRPRPPYDDPQAFEGAQGDGFLVYPGKKYGIDGPIPSIRLMTIRDGMEDYEYLYLLQELSSEYADKFRVEGFDFEDFMSDIYDRLYLGTQPYTDVSVLEEARKEVAEQIGWIAGDVHAMVVVDEIDAVEQKALVSLYTVKGAEVQVPEGTTLLETADSGEGTRRVYEVELDNPVNYFEPEITVNEKTQHIVKFICNKTKSAFVFDTEDEVEQWSHSSGSDDVESGYQKDHIKLLWSEDYGEGAMYVEILPYRGSEYENAMYSPTISVSREALFASDMFAQIENLELDIYNDSGKDVTVTIRLSAGTRTKRLTQITLMQGWNHIAIPKMYALTWLVGENNAMEAVDGVVFEFSRQDIDTIKLYFDNIFYTYKNN